MAISIASIEMYLPKEIITNEKLSRLQNNEVSASEIKKRTGISQRYIAAFEETALDMAAKVGKLFFDKNPNLLSQVDYLIFCSECYDFIAPSSACILQERLGLPTSIGAFDLPYGCSGYVYGLGLSNALITSGMAKNVLFITADTSTKTIAEDNFELRSLFSDIATASYITHSTQADLQSHFVFGTDGRGYANLMVDYSGFRNREANPNPSKLIHGELKMNSTEIFRFAIKEVPKLVKSLLEKYNCAIDSIDLFIFHQASYYLLEIVRRKINAPKEKFYVNLENFGNSVSSTIPVALLDAELNGNLKRGMKIMLVGFGIGYSWGGTIIEY
jgi:3-oxoacyl-[acyl-carrier-protein] synthase-3